MAVCLHCLHEARVAARERRQRAIMRFGVWTLCVAIVGVVGTAGVNAATNHPTRQSSSQQTRRAAKPLTPRPDSVSTVAPAAAAPVVQQGGPLVAPTPVADSASHSAPAAPSVTIRAVASRPDSAVRPAVVAIAPVVPEGRTDLHDSLYVERRGDTVVVHFDTSPARTRRADKFESVVRETLRTVYGPIADTVLAAVPPGRLAMRNELVTTLPAKGIHLTASRGARIGVWPETRPGRDGPLVVAYRTLVER